MGHVMGCWATDVGTLTWGHHDYSATWGIFTDFCRAFVINSTYPEGVVVYSNTVYLPKIGNESQSLDWLTANTGDPVPSRTTSCSLTTASWQPRCRRRRATAAA
jgi:hypothetical protein